MTEKVSYNLIIDKDRDAIIHYLIMYHMNRKDEMFKELAHIGITKESFMDFLNEKSDKHHEMGWCEDPNCLYGKE